MRPRYLFYFTHNTRMVEFGPYEELWEAENAFQWRYGYFPTEFIGQKVWGV